MTSERADIELQLQRAERLAAIAERIGFALWQIQELEGCSAVYLALCTEVTDGMGASAGNAILEGARKRTFGATVREMSKADLLTGDLKSRFERALSERNWIVHRSREDSRSAVYHDKQMNKLIKRIEIFCDETLDLLRQIGRLVEARAASHGVNKEYVDRVSKQILDEWQAAD